MNRYKVLTSLILILTWILTGCMNDANQKLNETENRKSLKVLYATVEAGSEAVINAAERYELRTGIHVEVSAFPYNSLQEKVFSELLRKSDEYDLIAIDTPWMPKIIQHIEPLTAYMEQSKQTNEVDDFIAKLFLDTSVFDKDAPHKEPPAMDIINLDRITESGFDIWSLPIQSNALTVSYRKDLFEDPIYQKQFEEQYHRKLTIPQTLDEYLEIAAFFTRDSNQDGTIDRYGTTLMASKHESNFVDFKSFLSIFGGHLFDDKLKPVFNSDKGVKALETYGSWILEEKVTPPDVLSYTWDEVEIAFSYGQVAMGMNYHDMRLNPKVKGGEVGYFMLPGVEHNGVIKRGPHFGSYGLAINKYSNNKQAAFELADYLTSSRTQKEYLQFRQHVTRKSAYEASRTLSDPSLREYYQVLGESLSVGVGRPRITNYEQLSEAVQTAVQQYLTGERSAKEALDEAAVKVEQSMKDNGY
ncbi:ABC transporter substrate-binding protein [Paenibacillus sp. sgz302251]|uniref:ABC transporter substrate-binding protein n=1 Tax=Paenibacillus sp. sgz302251 TaxID=3414493 RepID=UPI003C7DC678